MAEQSTGNGFPKALGALMVLAYLGGAIALFQGAETVSAVIYLLAGLLIAALFLGLLGADEELNTAPAPTPDSDPISASTETQESSPPLRPRGIATEATELPPASEDSPAAAEETATETEEPAKERENLTRIEGIGPKIQGLLYDAGIETFADLAAAEIEALQEVLTAAGSRYRLANPESWPEQAQIAATGDWDALKKLQDELDGGRRKA